MSSGVGLYSLAKAVSSSTASCCRADVFVCVQWICQKIVPAPGSPVVNLLQVFYAEVEECNGSHQEWCPSCGAALFKLSPMYLNPVNPINFYASNVPTPNGKYPLAVCAQAQNARSRRRTHIWICVNGRERDSSEYMGIFACLTHNNRWGRPCNQMCPSNQVTGFIFNANSSTNTATNLAGHILQFCQSAGYKWKRRWLLERCYVANDTSTVWKSCIGKARRAKLYNL